MQAAAEIVQTFRPDPRIVLLDDFNSLLYEVRSEELGKRGGHGLWPGFQTTEVDVCVHREANARKEVLVAQHFLAGKTGCLPQAQPRFDTAFISLPSIVVGNAPEPGPPVFTRRQL